MNILKDPKLTTLPDAIERLGITAQNPTEDTNAFNLAGQKPETLGTHDILSHYTLLGITPEQFLKEHGSDTFDFDKLKREFSKICTDYNEELQNNVASYALQFCALVLYKIAPASRQVKAKTGDKTWALKFVYANDGRSAISVKTCFISTYKNENANYTQEDVQNNKLCISVKHASLLAMVVLNKMIIYSMNLTPPVILLTPLSGAIFCRQDIPSIAKESRIDPKTLIQAINCSCQSGGQYLQESIMAIAVAASITATSGLRAKGKKAMANNIVTKTIKQYLTAKKDFDEDLFVMCCRYANGGVPMGMDAKSLINLYNAAKAADFKPEKPMLVKANIASTQIDVEKNAITGGYEAVVASTSGGMSNLYKVKKPPTAADVKRTISSKKYRGDDEGNEED